MSEFLVTPVGGPTGRCDRCPSSATHWVSPKTSSSAGLGFALGEPLLLCEPHVKEVTE